MTQKFNKSSVTYTFQSKTDPTATKKTHTIQYLDENPDDDKLIQIGAAYGEILPDMTLTEIAVDTETVVVTDEPAPTTDDAADDKPTGAGRH